jgi:hypothetical protein
MNRSRAIETDAHEGEEREHRRPEDVDEEGWIEDEVGEEDDFDGGRRGGGDGWDEEGEDVIPPRPRGRLLRPLPLFLIAVTIAAAGFLGGVLAQKGSEGEGSGSLPGGGNLPSFASGGPTAEAGGAEGGEASSGAPTAGRETAGGEGTSAEGGATGLPSFGGSESAASGTVTSVEGHTIYVKESDGTVIAVKVGDGATVTRNSDVNAKKIHPGDSVTVEGSKNGSTVKASSVAATESGVETTSGFSPPSSATSAGGEGGGAEAETSVESLFEE